MKIIISAIFTIILLFIFNYFITVLSNTNKIIGKIDDIDKNYLVIKFKDKIILSDKKNDLEIGDCIKATYIPCFSEAYKKYEDYTYKRGIILFIDKIPSKACI